ncbi:MAG TPA: ferritin-like domain-containing protein [Pyrinomonadaceae bacterium]
MESTGLQDDTAKLINILRLAYSGERAAGYAYRGHWRSVIDPEERTRIKAIEEEEWHHRRLVGEMLESLGAEPDQRREIRAIIVGRTLGFLCHLSGWLAPMYGAGKLESRNIVEYEIAARYARDCGRHDLIDCLLTMAEVEWDHEAFFRACVLRHPLGRRLSIWPEPPAKANIRRSFLMETSKEETLRQDYKINTTMEPLDQKVPS